MQWGEDEVRPGPATTPTSVPPLNLQLGARPGLSWAPAAGADAVTVAALGPLSSRAAADAPALLALDSGAGAGRSGVGPSAAGAEAVLSSSLGAFGSLLGAQQLGWHGAQQLEWYGAREARRLARRARL